MHIIMHACVCVGVGVVVRMHVCVNVCVCVCVHAREREKEREACKGEKESGKEQAYDQQGALVSSHEAGPPSCPPRHSRSKKRRQSQRRVEA